MLPRILLALGVAFVAGAIASLPAAAAEFKRLDPDNDGTLDAQELAGRVTDEELRGTLDLNEYNALIEKRFNAANPDNDGTLDETELKSPAGQSLLLLIQ